MKPKVFVNSINKNIKNNKESYHYTKNELKDIDIIDDSRDLDINSKINNIFDSDSFVYKSSVIITLKNGIETKEDIIAIRDSYLITLSNKRISLSDIIDIKKAN